MAAKLSGPGGGKGHTIEQNADINVTPFVDIMLVLLIIFMVAAPMATVSIRLDLPPAVPPPPDAAPDRLNGREPYSMSSFSRPTLKKPLDCSSFMTSMNWL